MATINELYAALSGDVTEVQAVTDAQAAKTTADQAVVDAQAALDAANAEDPIVQEDVDIAQTALDIATADAETAATELTTAQDSVDTGDSVALAAKLPITDFGMVSNDMARAILAARGEEVMFEEPVNVDSDHNMNLIT